MFVLPERRGKPEINRAPLAADLHSPRDDGAFVERAT